MASAHTRAHTRGSAGAGVRDHSQSVSRKQIQEIAFSVQTVRRLRAFVAWFKVLHLEAALVVPGALAEVVVVEDLQHERRVALDPSSTAWSCSCSCSCS